MDIPSSIEPCSEGTALSAGTSVHIRTGSFRSPTGEELLIKGEIVNGTGKAVRNVAIVTTAYLEDGSSRGVNAGFTGGIAPPGGSSTFWSRLTGMNSEKVISRIESLATSWDTLETYRSPEVVFDNIEVELVDGIHPRTTGYFSGAGSPQSWWVHVVYEGENGEFIVSDETSASSVLRNGRAFGFFTAYSTPPIDSPPVVCYRLFVTPR